ncbi:MAG: hypothetical protein FGF48_04685 [Candidatus Brockarchaeota archaeon]|nr:hypothetical protein [Candidatus Brockarchaeota archaeon]
MGEKTGFKRLEFSAFPSSAASLHVRGVSPRCPMPSECVSRGAASGPKDVSDGNSGGGLSLECDAG